MREGGRTGGRHSPQVFSVFGVFRGEWCFEPPEINRMKETG